MPHAAHKLNFTCRTVRYNPSGRDIKAKATSPKIGFCKHQHCFNTERGWMAPLLVQTPHVAQEARAPQENCVSTSIGTCR